MNHSAVIIPSFFHFHNTQTGKKILSLWDGSQSSTTLAQARILSPEISLFHLYYSDVLGGDIALADDNVPDLGHLGCGQRFPGGHNGQVGPA